VCDVFIAISRLAGLLKIGIRTPTYGGCGLPAAASLGDQPCRATVEDG
jgi:hypothetical protein